MNNWVSLCLSARRKGRDTFWQVGRRPCDIEPHLATRPRGSTDGTKRVSNWNHVFGLVRWGCAISRYLLGYVLRWSTIQSPLPIASLWPVPVHGAIVSRAKVLSTLVKRRSNFKRMSMAHAACQTRTHDATRVYPCSRRHCQLMCPICECRPLVHVPTSPFSAICWETNLRTSVWTPVASYMPYSI